MTNYLVRASALHGYRETVTELLVSSQVNHVEFGEQSESLGDTWSLARFMTKFLSH